MGTITIRVRDSAGMLTVWFPGLELSAYTTKVKLREGLSEYQKRQAADEERVAKIDELEMAQESFINYLESVSRKQVLPDGMVVYIIKNPSSLSKVDFSVITSRKAVALPIYFIDNQKNLAALWLNGKFLTKEDPEFDLYLVGFSRTKFCDELSIV
jgi:hypothetical protein